MLARALRILIALSALLLAHGCGFLDPDSCSCSPAYEIDLAVHLGSWFQDDLVEVAIDGKTVFDQRVTTLDVLSLAKIIELKYQPGLHHLEVTVNGLAQETTTFYLDRPLYALVSYFEEPLPDRPAGVHITVTATPPVYD